MTFAGKNVSVLFVYHADVTLVAQPSSVWRQVWNVSTDGRRVIQEPPTTSIPRPGMTLSDTIKKNQITYVG